jgi:hypothetical protein
MFKYIRTTAGIFLSFVIAIGGLKVTSRLIDMESYRLLSGTRSFVVDIPTMESIHAHEDNGDIPLNLNEDEIVSILRNWELTDYRRPHEPAVGQLNMEQAIASGRAGLIFLYNHNILPMEMMTLNNTEAILSQNVPQSGEFLPLRYSYWNVTFRNEVIEVLMTINALTGQVWGIEVTTNQTTTVMLPTLLHIPISHDKINNMLDDFMSGLGILFNDRTELRTIYLIENDEPEPTRPSRDLYVLIENHETVAIHEIHFGIIRAHQSFTQGEAAVIITASGTPVTDEMCYIKRFNIHLTALFDFTT